MSAVGRRDRSATSQTPADPYRPVPTACHHPPSQGPVPWEVLLKLLDVCTLKHESQVCGLLVDTVLQGTAISPGLRPGLAPVHCTG